MRRRLAALLLATLAPATLAGGSPAAEPLDAARRHVLANGLTVLLLPEPGAPLVSVGTMYAAGARNEAAGTTGLAHFVEHMCFRSLEGYPGSEATDGVTRVGGRWTGYTWIDQTWYAETVPRGFLGRSLDVAAERMAGARFDPAEFEQERTSVLAELRSYDDPHSLLYDAVLAASFEIHPYRHNTIGWPADVEGVTRDEAFAFYRRFYHPANAVLVVVGDFEPAALLAEIERRFAVVPAGGGRGELRAREPEQTGERRLVLRRPGGEAHLIAAFRAPALDDPDFPALVLFDALFAGGKGLRLLSDYATRPDTPLAAALVAPGLAREAATGWQASRYPYVWSVEAALAEASGLAAAEAALFAALAQAGTREWTSAELERARGEVLLGHRLDLDRQAERAHQLAFFQVSSGGTDGYRTLRELPGRLARLTPDDLRRFAGRWLGHDRATIGWFVPTPAPTGGAGAVPSTASAPVSVPATQPAVSPGASLEAPAASAAAGEAAAAAPAAPVPHTFTLDNGTRLTLTPVPGSGLVALHGRLRVLPEDEGEAEGSRALLVERLATPVPGEPTHPPLEWTLREEPTAPVNGLAAEFAAAALPQQVDALLAALSLRLAATREAPEADVWGRLRRDAAERAEALAGSAPARLRREALARLFAGPAARVPWGEPAALRERGARDVVALAERVVRGGRLELSLAGDVDPTRVRRQLAAGLGRLPGGAGAPTPAPRGRGPGEWTRVDVTVSGAGQDRLLVALPLAATTPERQAARQALAYLLGETGYAGRLGRALVAPGLVYSVYARLEAQPEAPLLLTIATAAAPGDTAEVLRRIRGVLEELARGRFTPEDLEEARAYLEGKAARERDGARALARLGLDAGEALPPPTLEALSAAARELFALGAPLAIVAGPHGQTTLSGR